MQESREQIRRIMIAVNVIDGIYEKLSKTLGVKENTLVLLYALDDGKPHTQKELCENWLMPKTTLNTIVKECVSAGYMVLHSEEGKKEKEICLTEKGRAYAQAVLQKVYRVEAQAMAATLRAATPAFIEGLECFTGQLQQETRHFINEPNPTV